MPGLLSTNDSVLPLAVNNIDTATPINNYISNTQSDQNTNLAQQLMRGNIAMQPLQQAQTRAETGLIGAQTGQVGAQTQLSQADLVAKNFANASTQSQQQMSAHAILASMVQGPLAGNDLDTVQAQLDSAKSNPLLKPVAEEFEQTLKSNPKAFKGQVDANVHMGQLAGVLTDPNAPVPMDSVLRNKFTGAPVGGDPTASAAPTDTNGAPLTGDALLTAPKSSATDHAIAINAIADGTAAMPQGGFRTMIAKQNWESEVADAHRADPTTNMDRPKAVGYWNSGDGAQRITSAGAAANHLQSLSGLIPAINNGDVQALNTINNAFGTEFGSDKASNLTLANQLIAGETAKFLTSTGGTGGDREGFQEQLAPHMSDTQLTGAQKVFRTFIGGQLQSMGNTYKNGTGHTDFAQRLLNPNSQSILQDYNKNEAAAAPAGAAQGAGGWKYIGKAN